MYLADNLATNLVDVEDEHISVSEKPSKKIDYEAMMKGYMEMSQINLEMANEGLYVENEADNTISKLIGEDW